MCDICDKNLRTSSGLKTHMELHANKRNAEDKKYKNFIAENFDMSCDQCSHIFSSFYEARKHYKDIHDYDSGYIKCCNKKLGQNSLIIEHIKIHFNPETFK